MNEVFEKILKRLEADEKHTFDGCINKRYAKKIVQEVAEESATDTNVGTNGWIPVEERMPEEHESMFAKLKGTDKWVLGMFEKMSDDVNVTVEFDNGKRKTMTLHTNDGKWNTNYRIANFKVVAWQPLPEPYQPKGE